MIASVLTVLMIVKSSATDAVCGNSSLIHAPLYHDGLMYGILEPCMIEAPRAWSDADRATTVLVQQSIAPAAADHVARHCPG